MKKRWITCGGSNKGCYSCLQLQRVDSTATVVVGDVHDTTSCWELPPPSSCSVMMGSIMLLILRRTTSRRHIRILHGSGLSIYSIHAFVRFGVALLRSRFGAEPLDHDSYISRSVGRIETIDGSIDCSSPPDYRPDSIAVRIQVEKHIQKRIRDA